MQIPDVPTLLSGALVLLAGCQTTVRSDRLPTGPVADTTDEVFVMVAARDLYPGVAIGEEDLVAIELSPAFLPEGVFLDPRKVVGERPKHRILANEWIRADRLADPQRGTGLADILPRGMRVVDVGIVGQAPDAGSYVDVWVTPEGQAACGLLQSVFVMGPGGPMDSEASVPGRVQLLTTPTHALRLGRFDTVELLLRNDGDHRKEEMPPCSL